MMDIIKKNVVSIICGVVALAALIYGMVILPGKAAEQQKELDARKAAYETLNSLLTKERQLPVVNPDNPTQEKLTKFPSENVIKQGEAITKKVEDESRAMVEAAVEMNRHQLMVPDSLPAPSATKAFDFRTRYQQLLPLPNQGGVMKSKFAADLKAGIPPTAEEIRVKQEELAKQIKEKKLFYLANGQPANAQSVEAEIKERAAKLPAELRQQMAEQIRIYIHPDTFEINPRISAAAGAPDPIDMYFAQLSFWIQQDVVAAINEVNASAKNVQDAPVKFLASIRCGPGGVPTFVRQPDGAANADPDGVLPKVNTVSATGRVSNGLFDVFFLEIKADVEAAKLGEFLRGLGTRRFMTPLKVDIKVVDNALALAEWHVYGNHPVLNVTVQCEALYLRKWNAPFMPQKIREMLGIPAEGAAPAAPGAAPGAEPAPAATPAASAH